MLLAKLSHPRSLRPDMENWFKQDKSRISRFIALALNHVYRLLAYTLAFDTQYLHEHVPFFAKQIEKPLVLQGQRSFVCGAL